MQCQRKLSPRPLSLEQVNQSWTRLDCCKCVLSCVWFFATLWTIARQTPPSMILQEILEWVAISSRGSSQHRATWKVQHSYTAPQERLFIIFMSLRGSFCCRNFVVTRPYLRPQWEDIVLSETKVFPTLGNNSGPPARFHCLNSLGPSIECLVLNWQGVAVRPLYLVHTGLRSSQVSIHPAKQIHG